MEDAAYDGYEKIPQTPAEWGLDDQAQRKISRMSWTVTEKIHGANFCILLDQHNITAAKRREVIPAGESFFGHERIIDKLGEALRELWRLAAASRPTLARLDVHGELFGGAYPHPEVAQIAGVEAVQTGIWYAPDVEFMAFDLACWAPDEAGELERSYLGYEEARALCEAACVPWIEALAICSWADALAYNIDFDSTIPARLGLPPLEVNRAEGVVIKPADATLFDGIRPVLKRKIEAFAEDARFHGAQAWREPVASHELPALSLLEWEVLSRLNAARLDSAISKVGRPRDAADQRVAAVVDEVARDVEGEVAQAHEGLWRALKADERALLLEVLRDEAAGLIGARFGA